MRSTSQNRAPEPTSRRNFLTQSAAAVSVSAVAASLGMTGGICHAKKNESEGTKEMKPEAAACLDYGLSFICNTLPTNSARFWIESRTTVIDDLQGVSTEFYQCASCKSEDTFAKKDLFYKENYDFLPIFGGKEAEDLLVFRRKAGLCDRYRTIVKAEEYWGKPVLKLRQGQKVKVLETWEQIRDATAAAVPIVSQTEICNPETKLRAIIECPVKTMNIGHPNRMYQVDTGPIAYADLSRRFEPMIDCLSLAFIAFNAPHFADFVIEQLTSINDEGKEPCQVYHYSNPISVPAKNTLLALGDF